MKYKIFKIKEGKIQQWKDWCIFLNEHKPEVLETLKEEKVTRECAVLRGDTVFYFMIGEGHPSSDTELNIQHRKNVKECLEPVEGEVLFDFNL